MAEQPLAAWGLELPADWRVSRLGDLFDIQQGKALGPRAREGDSSRPFLRTANVLWGHVDLSELDTMNFDTDERDRFRLKPGDLLVCEGGDIGRTALWRGEAEECYHQNHVHRLRAKTKDVLPEFYVYWMQAALTSFGLYQGYGNKTTIPNLSKGRLSNFEVPGPPLSEQQEIVRVLSTVRKAQLASMKVVEATRETKRSLMTSFFSNGGWPRATLGSVARFIMGQSPPSEFYNSIGEGLPFLQGKAEFTEKYPRPTKYCTQKLKVAPAGSVLMSVRAPVGDTNLADREYIIGRGVASLRLEDGNNEFLFYLLTYFKPKVEALGSGTTFDSVNKGDLERLAIPIPPLKEQTRIATMIATVDKKISAEVSRLSELGDLYQTLLSELLSGRIRLPAKGS